MATDTQVSAIRESLDLLCEPGAVYELRVFPRANRTDSGYFDDMDRLARVAARLSGKVPAVYVTINPVLPDLLARRSNRVEEWSKNTTSDAQIVRRRWLPIDFDAQRPAGISSTDAEHDQALERARECRAWLRSQGWPEPILADSGNGAHLLYRVDLPNDQASTTLTVNCLKALAFKFDDGTINVDTGNFNAARIWKLYGTKAGKGDNTPDRPHRLARILEVP